MWDVITHTCLNLNDALTELPLNKTRVSYNISGLNMDVITYPCLFPFTYKHPLVS